MSAAFDGETWTKLMYAEPNGFGVNADTASQTSYTTRKSQLGAAGFGVQFSSVAGESVRLQYPRSLRFWSSELVQPRIASRGPSNILPSPPSTPRQLYPHGAFGS